MHLNKGLSWKRIAVLVREAYEKVAHPKLRAAIGDTIEISPPNVKLTPEQIDPMKSARAQRVLKLMRKICLAWPETSEEMQFGYPVWKGGKKSFAGVYFRGDALKTCFWTGGRPPGPAHRSGRALQHSDVHGAITAGSSSMSAAPPTKRSSGTWPATAITTLLPTSGCSNCSSPPRTKRTS